MTGGWISKAMPTLRHVTFLDYEACNIPRLLNFRSVSRRPIAFEFRADRFNTCCILLALFFYWLMTVLLSEKLINFRQLSRRYCIHTIKLFFFFIFCVLISFCRWGTKYNNSFYITPGLSKFFFLIFRNGEWFQHIIIARLFNLIFN